MDRGFLALTAVLAAVTFGGIWHVTGLAADAGPATDLSPTPVRPPTPTRPQIVIRYQPPPRDAAHGVPLRSPAEPASHVGPDVYYAGCDEVRALGLAPLRAGQPGYRMEMDGDGDGLACEPHRY